MNASDQTDPKLTVVIQARATRAERERWHEMAWRRRTTVSELVRALLTAEAAQEFTSADAMYCQSWHTTTRNPSLRLRKSL